MQKDVFISEYLAEKITYFKFHRSVDSLHYKKFCIGYLVKGSAEYLCDGVKYSLKEGDLIYIPKNSVCVSLWEGSPDIVFYSVNFDVSYGEGMEQFGMQVVGGIEEPLLATMVAESAGHYMKSLGHFYILLDQLFSKMEKGCSGKLHMIAPAVQYLKENCATRTSVEKLAKLCNLSVSGLYIYFKKELGCTPVQYKNNLLIQRAAQLLLDGELSVEETARKLGFSSMAYFRSLFKNLTGKLPKEFKK